MTWGTPIVPQQAFNPNDANYKPQPDNPAWCAERDRILAEWEAAKITLGKAQETEMTSRKLAQLFAFGPNAKEGMNNQPLNNGFTLKFGKKLNYNLTAPVAKIDEAEDKAKALGERAALLFERCVFWTPEFSKSEYNKLDTSVPEDAEVKKLVDGLLEIKEATGSLEIKAPKAGLNG
jgi:hypothetical protein